MKILILISTPELGGAQRVAINMVEWITHNTPHNAILVSLSNSKRNSYDTSNLNYVSLQGKNKIRGVRRILIQERPDIMLTMGVPLCLYSVPACIGTGVKHIVSERNDPAHFAGKTFVRVLSRAFLRLADGYVFQTHDAQRYYGGNIARKSTIIHNPLFDLQKMPMSRYCGTRKKIIASVGRLNPQKNQLMLLNAFAEVHKQFPDYNLIIYGEGELRSSLEEHIKHLGLNSCIMLPGSTNNILELIYDVSLFVLPSDFEGMPNALMEAMALGLPCISTDCPCGGPSELISQDQNGLLVPVNNQMQLTEAILSILTDEKKAEELSKEAFKIRHTHNKNVICKQWLDYFKRIVYEK